MSRGRRLLLALIGSLVFGSTAPGATLFDPGLRFRVLATPHFRIYFHQGEDRLASRLAVIAEETWTALGQRFDVTPPRLSHVVLVDQTELANGYATPLPYDTIVIYPVWPRSSEFYTNDWLRIAFTHEFTHIVHLDRSESWARAVRGIFGRTLLAFPNLLLPTWQVEGLATYEESAMTGEGRLHAAEFRAIVDEAARHGRLEPLDRANGGLTDWPGGQTAYAYGVSFHQYLVDRFGAQSLGKLAEATARRVPYTSSRSFRRIFGEPLGDLWRDYEARLTADAGPPALDADISRLTHQGFVVSAPRFDRLACGSCAPEIVYASRTPHDFPSLNRLRIDGSAARRMTRRYLGSTTAVGRAALYFDQIEVRRDVGEYSDLFELSRRTGRTRQITSEARLSDPDLSPDETTIACVQQRPGQRDLVLVHLGARPEVESLIAEPDTQFNAPRWSPDGGKIAVERHVLGSQSEIVVVDVRTRAVRVIATELHARLVTPTWRRDGLAIVAAVSEGDQPFNLFEFPVDATGSARQLTHTSGGAIWPDISHDGKTLLFVGYTTGGYDVFAMPYPSPPVARSAEEKTDLRMSTVSSELRAQSPPPTGNADAYSPLPTLGPTSWFPVIQSDRAQIRFGAVTSGRDVLGYHLYSASATWLVSGPANAPSPQAAAPDWFVSYAYDRWRPTLFTSASRSTSFFAGPATTAGRPTSATRRAHELEAGVVVPFVHTRLSHVGVAALVRASDDYLFSDRILSRNRTGARFAWETATAHTYGYSVSPERGVQSGMTVELVRRGLGSSADATTVTGDVRGYLPGLATHHVLAARLAAGRSTGDSTVGRTFLLGGPYANAGVIDFGSGAISLLRGFPSNSFAGSHVALVNLDYRWPLAWPQRGIGTWPIFVHTIHAAVFADAGHAWTRAFDVARIKTSEGAELSADIIVGYYFPLTVAAGAAWGHDGSGAIASGVSAYFRVGKAF